MMEIIDISVPGSPTKYLKMRNSKVSENGWLSLFWGAIFITTQSLRGQGGRVSRTSDSGNDSEGFGSKDSSD
jgi:hypothetical protein